MTGVKGTVLIVDDSELVLESARLALEAAGYRVVTLQSPLELPIVARRVNPDVVLLDVAMPALRGDVALRIVRENHVLEDAFVLLHSAREAGELEDLRRTSGADGAILKSGDAEELIRQVSSWVGKAQMRRARRADAAATPGAL